MKDPVRKFMRLDHRHRLPSRGAHLRPLPAGPRRKEAPELHTDPVVQSYALEQVAKQSKRTRILLSAPIRYQLVESPD